MSYRISAFFSPFFEHYKKIFPNICSAIRSQFGKLFEIMTILSKVRMEIRCHLNYPKMVKFGKIRNLSFFAKRIKESLFVSIIPLPWDLETDSNRLCKKEFLNSDFEFRFSTSSLGFLFRCRVRFLTSSSKFLSGDFEF